MTKHFYCQQLIIKIIHDKCFYHQWFLGMNQLCYSIKHVHCVSLPSICHSILHYKLLSIVGCLFEAPDALLFQVVSAVYLIIKLF